ncbi:hypothetical protein BGZ82_000770 [Podila clonocystis]|nr:hypothetical protein BGZ82_000770 [Podila clonocystis]
MAPYTPERAEEIADNLARVQSRMEETLRSITNAQKAQLVAVSKYKPASDILAAYEKAGHRHFGENYLPSDIKWHFIGTLQSNKCKTVAGEDSAYEEVLPNDANQSGMLPSEVLDVARHVVSSCAHLKFAGLMTIGSPNPDLENGENPDFKTLSECRATIQETLKIDDLGLSMGMSDDFPRALLQGSTNIRVGSTIFGSRPPFTKST